MNLLPVVSSVHGLVSIAAENIVRSMSEVLDYSPLRSPCTAMLAFLKVLDFISGDLATLTETSV